MAAPLIRAALYLAVAGLFGSAWTWSRGRRPIAPHARVALIGCALACAAFSVVGLYLQTKEMSGGEASPALVWSVARDVSVGRATVVRVLASLCAASLLAGRQGRRTLRATAVLGAGAAASLAWGGHGAAGEGAAGLLHLAADLAHLLAAAFWIGAIAGLLLDASAASAGRPEQVRAVHEALASFSAPGTAAVALLTATGLINAWFLIGPGRLAALYSDPYGRLLALKLALFAVMLSLAAANRWRHVAALRSGGARALRDARLSLALELAAGIGVMLAVGWMGVLPPPGEP